MVEVEEGVSAVCVERHDAAVGEGKSWEAFDLLRTRKTLLGRE